jgi:hypothetical protein
VCIHALIFLYFLRQQGWNSFVEFLSCLVLCEFADGRMDLIAESRKFEVAVAPN